MAKEGWTKKQILILIIIALIAFAIGLIPNVVKNYYQSNEKFIGELAEGPGAPSGSDPDCPMCPGTSTADKKACKECKDSKFWGCVIAATLDFYVCKSDCKTGICATPCSTEDIECVGGCGSCSECMDGCTSYCNHRFGKDVEECAKKWD